MFYLIFCDVFRTLNDQVLLYTIWLFAYFAWLWYRFQLLDEFWEFEKEGRNEWKQNEPN